MKRVVFIPAIILLICAAAPPVPPAMYARAQTAAPETSAQSVILIDADTGRVLHESNADAPMRIASTTKILTALVALERAAPDDTVTVKREWTGIEGSSLYLRENEEISMRDLLYGLMLASGNDAATAIAGHVAGGNAEFALLMNEKAAALGCAGSYFVNPHGLDADGHLATARDLAAITRAALDVPAFREIVSTKYHTGAGRTWRNHNRLLWNYDGVIGVKTGFTRSAGRSLVSAAERGGIRLICVTLNAPDDWRDHSALYDWAFGAYENITVTPETAVDATVRVISGESDTVGVRVLGEHTFLVPSGGAITYEADAPPFEYAVIVRGASAGTLTVKCDGDVVGRVPLVYAETVLRREAERVTLREQLKRAWHNAYEYNWFRSYF